MPKIDLSNGATYVFYLLLLAGAGFAETKGLVPAGTLVGLFGGLGIGHGVATSVTTSRVLNSVKADPPGTVTLKRTEPVEPPPAIAVPVE